MQKGVTRRTRDAKCARSITKFLVEHDLSVNKIGLYCEVASDVVSSVRSDFGSLLRSESCEPKSKICWNWSSAAWLLSVEATRLSTPNFSMRVLACPEFQSTIQQRCHWKFVRIILVKFFESDKNHQCSLCFGEFRERKRIVRQSGMRTFEHN